MPTVSTRAARSRRRCASCQGGTPPWSIPPKRIGSAFGYRVSIIPRYRETVASTPLLSCFNSSSSGFLCLCVCACVCILAPVYISKPAEDFFLNHYYCIIIFGLGLLCVCFHKLLVYCCNTPLFPTSAQHTPINLFPVPHTFPCPIVNKSLLGMFPTRFCLFLH